MRYEGGPDFPAVWGRWVGRVSIQQALAAIMVPQGYFYALSPSVHNPRFDDGLIAEELLDTGFGYLLPEVPCGR